MSATVQSRTTADPVTGDTQIPFRLRRDLETSPQRQGQVDCWAVKDPVSLNYYHFGVTEWYLLNQLDGAITLNELQTRFQTRFPPLTISLPDLRLFISRAWNDHLLQSTRPSGEGRRLLAHAGALRRRKWAAGVLGILAIRFRGINPQWFLAGLTPLVGWIFSPLVVGIVLALAALTTVFAAIQIDAVIQRIPDLSVFLRGEQLLQIAIAFAFVKVLHELGHATSCQKFGGRCPEMGIMLLCFVPCMYCDVSDSWMMKRRWQRLMVAAAGIYVELILATIFFWLWFFSVPGVFNAFALKVVLIASVSTLLANGNPLLRYDGYFILSDLWGVPNLASRSRLELGALVRRFFFHARADELNRRQHRFDLAAYALASLVYRIFIVTVILGAFYRALQPKGFVLLAFLLSLIVGFSWLLAISSGLKRMATVKNVASLRWSHLILLAMAVSSLVWFSTTVPLNFRIAAPLEVELQRPLIVYAAVDGRLIWATTANTAVHAGETLARLENARLENQYQSLQRQLRLKQTAISNLRRLEFVADHAIQLHLLEAKVADLQQQLALIESQRNKCEISAPLDGVVYPAPYKQRRFDSDRILNTWFGDLLSPDNIGCQVVKGEPVCLISDGGLQAVAYVSQNDIERVHVGASVDLLFDSATPRPYRGHVVEIAPDRVLEVPSTLRPLSALHVRRGDNGIIEFAEPVFRVTIEMDAWPRVFPGTQGVAKIDFGGETCAQHFSRFLQRTFRFEW